MTSKANSNKDEEIDIEVCRLLNVISCLSRGIGLEECMHASYTPRFCFILTENCSDFVKSLRTDFQPSMPKCLLRTVKSARSLVLSVPTACRLRMQRVDLGCRAGDFLSVS
jgi:hypothetical protein